MVMPGVLADVMLSTTLRFSGLAVPRPTPRTRVSTRHRLAMSVSSSSKLSMAHAQLGPFKLGSPSRGWAYPNCVMKGY
jgi:hypothetical protein